MKKKEQSFGRQRKELYARMAGESIFEKESRNRRIETALGEGATNLVQEKKKVTTYVWEKKDPDDKFSPIVKKKVRVWVGKVDITKPSTLPSDSSPAVKRARLKASRHYIVSGLRHPHGACGNIGCKKCSPIAAKLYMQKWHPSN